MEQPLDAIAEAFTKLGQSISHEDARTFESTRLEDVWKAVREIENTQRQRQSAQNLRRVEPLLKGIEKYAKVIEVLCNGTPFMPYVWAPIKLMIQLASQHQAILEALLHAYAEIGAALPRFDKYENIFKDNKEFQSVLAAVYSGILEFHQRAYKFFRKRAWHSLFLSLWRDFKSRFAGIIDRLKEQRDFVDREAMSVHLVESKESRYRLQQDIQQRYKYSVQLLEQSEMNAGISRLQHAVAWLSIDDRDQEAQHHRISTKRHDETCQWIMKHSQMKSWLRDDTSNPVLWLSGKPGAGKSVMCSFIVQELIRISTLDSCYYFCSGQDADHDYGHLLRTLALQLLRRNLDLASMISNEFVYKGISCGVKVLKTLLPRMLQVMQCTRIIVDGIDELSKESQSLVLKDLQTFCDAETSHCKIIFSSRKEVYLLENLSKKPQICLDNRAEVNSDIKLYVKSAIVALRTLDEDLLNRIEAILVNKADGMFLWVRLVVDELRNCFSDWDLEEKANCLPRGLNEAYGRILKRIMAEHGPTSPAIRILHWMACCYRPLKIFEILDGISLRPNCTTLNRKTRMHKKVLDLCRPLVEDGPSGTLEFVHFSAKAYLLHEPIQQGETPFISYEEAHFSICFSCIAYLNTSYCLLPDLSTEQERAGQIVWGFHGLQPYANKFWTNHLLDYCAALRKNQKQFSRPLLDQLEELTAFQKRSSHEQLNDQVQLDGLEILNPHPRLVALVGKTIAFRTEIEQDKTPDSTEQSSEDAALERCGRDPTYFSTVFHYYQSTVELLLEPRAPERFPDIYAQQLQAFAETFGPSAFVCRHTRCSRTTQGFDSIKQRASHEASHERKFRCADPSCVSFSTGFATKAAINRHNQKYHAVIESHISLSQTISNAHLRRVPPNSINIPALVEHDELSLKDSELLQWLDEAELDGVDIPLAYWKHLQMPKSMPPDIKKWGELKLWLGHYFPDGLEMVRQMQIQYYQSIIRRRQTQQHDSSEMRQPGAQGLPTIPRDVSSMSSSVLSMEARPPASGKSVNASAQIQKMIFDTISLAKVPRGWQEGVIVNERMPLIFNIKPSFSKSTRTKPTYFTENDRPRNQIREDGFRKIAQ
ncbi:hypothetical protein BDZ45DRAFT_474377 [Acephala macrosclerotiorum]|nr:hypothetical protein BDZ45DRAFT_474377 [Acephala macrosclerotiorum]